MDKVLVVDHDPEMLDVLREELRKYKGQFEVLTASDLEKALDVLKRESISVLVTDLGMPQNKGLELLDLMRKKYPPVPCIAMAAPAGPEKKEAVKAPPEGVFNCIEKPFDVNQLANLIMEGLDCLDEGRYP